MIPSVFLLALSCEWFPSLSWTPVEGKKKSYRQHGSGQSEDGNTLFNDSVYFVHWAQRMIYSAVDFILRDPTAFLGDDEVAVQGNRKSASLWRLWPDMFSSFFSPQLEAIVFQTYDGSLSSA